MITEGRQNRRSHLWRFLARHRPVRVGHYLSRSFGCDLPIVVVGGGAGTVKGNRHLAHPISTPLANLHMAYAHKFGLDMQSFGDSNGVINL